MRTFTNVKLIKLITIIYKKICAVNIPAYNIQKMLFSKDKMIEGFVLFTIFHEIGHWQHLITSGL